MEYTSAEANKLLKRLEQKIKDIRLKEENCTHFRAAAEEDIEAIRPKYDFAATQAELDSLEAKARRIKHAINCFNVMHTLPGFADLTVDQALVWIPQLSKKVIKLREMAASLPKERVEGYRNVFIDYTIANYDIDECAKAYEETQKLLADLQLALDTVNTTEKMEIDVEFE